MGLGNEECWAVETSRDGEKWRSLGRAWKSPGEPVLMHVSVRFVRYRQLVPAETSEWSFCQTFFRSSVMPATVYGAPSK